MSESEWDPFEFNREREKARETIDAFMEPLSKNRKGPVRQQTQPQVQQESVKAVSLETRYNIVYSKSINDRFAQFRKGLSSGDEEEEEGEEREEREEWGENGMEEEEENMYADEEEVFSCLEESGEERQRKRKPPGSIGGKNGGGLGERKKRVKFDRATRSECPLCSHGNAQFDGIEAPHIKKLWDIIRSNNGYRDNLETAWEASLYYKAEIYPSNPNLPILTPEIVLDHIEGMHSLNAGLYLAEMIRRETKLMFLLGEAICLEDGYFDFKVLFEYRKSQKILNEYQRMRPDQMAFNQENNEEDLKRLASSISLLPSFGRKPKSTPPPPRGNKSNSQQPQQQKGSRQITIF